MSEILEPPKKKRRTLLGALRTYFLTGLVVTAPIYITFYLMLWFVEHLFGLFFDCFGVSQGSYKKLQESSKMVQKSYKQLY